MLIRYYIDPQTEQPHIYNHNVAESEVEEVLKTLTKTDLDVKALA